MRQAPSSFLWVLPFASFCIGYLFLSSLYTPHTFNTPELLGASLTDAMNRASSLDVTVRVLTQKTVPELPPGTILDQIPHAGTSIKKQQTISVVISAQPPPLTMPLLVGLSAEKVVQEIQQHELYNKLYYLPSTGKHKQCIGQHPQPHATVTSKKIITYFPKQESKPVLIPDLKQLPASSVIPFLDKHGITYSCTDKKTIATNHHCTDRCLITDQRPLAHSIIAHTATTPLHLHLQIEHQT